jgi:hypothetical protein
MPLDQRAVLLETPITRWLFALIRYGQLALQSSGRQARRAAVYSRSTEEVYVAKDHTTMVPEEDLDMANFVGRAFTVVVLAALLGMSLAPRQAKAVEVGEPAPPFNLAATTGGDISLNDFRGKKWVFLEFYGADFAPT